MPEPVFMLPGSAMQPGVGRRKPDKYSYDRKVGGVSPGASATAKDARPTAPKVVSRPGLPRAF